MENTDILRAKEAAKKAAELLQNHAWGLAKLELADALHALERFLTNSQK